MVKEAAPLGFVISSHAHPAQLRRLVETLNRLYADPPIACHHDFGQCAFDTAGFPANVRFVADPVRTSWGTWSLVRATTAALALLYEDGGPDWFVTLSAADYPVRDPDTVRALFAATDCDAFIDIHAQQPGTASAAAMVGEFNPALGHLETASTRTLKSSFYRNVQFWLPRLRRRPRLRLGRLTVRLPFRTRFYDDALPLYWGDAWFAGNRRVAQLLLAPTPLHLRLQRYLRWRTFPEESYFQTVLASIPELRLNRDNKRFTSWQGGAHPVEMGEAELTAALASDAHFARKFAPGSPVLDRIDALLAAGPPGVQP